MRAIEVIDPEFTDAHWQEYTQLLEHLHERFKSFHNRLTWQQKKRDILSVYESEMTQHRFLISDNDTLTGWFDVFVMNEGTPAILAFVGFDGDYERFPLEFSKVMAKTLRDMLKRHSCPKMYIMSTNHRSTKVIREWGGNEVSIVNRYELERKTVDVNMLRHWVETGQKDNPDVSLAYFPAVPEDILERYIELMRQCLSDMPHEHDSDAEFLPTIEDHQKQSAWRKKNGRFQCTTALFDKNRHLIGFSQLVISADDPTNAFQMMTGVDRAYRGRKLSNWLKAALILQIGEDFPDNEKITTDMRAVNAPIQHLNQKLGFELLSEGNEFEVPASVIADWLARQC